MYTIKYVRQSGSHHFTVTNEREQVCRVSIWPNADGTLAATLGSFGGQVWPCSFPELFAMESGKPSAQHPLQVELTPLAQAEFAAALPPSAQEIEDIFALLDEPAEAPLTPNQQKAEALLALEQEACFHTAIIKAHQEGAVCLAGPTLNESRIQRGQARMAQRQYFV